MRELPERRYAACALAAAALGVLMAMFVVGSVWRGGFFRVVPLSNLNSDARPMFPGLAEVNRKDLIFVAGRVRGNAVAISRRRLDLFDSESCAPQERSLALSDPLLPYGLTGLPGYLAGVFLGAEPVEAAGPHNSALLCWFALRALAVALLTYYLAYSIIAALAAAILYAFHVVPLLDIDHFFVYDHAWTVLAIFFLHRLVDRQRWRDAFGVAVCTLLQLGNAFYPTLAGIAIAAPYGVWFLRHGALRLPLSRWVCMISSVAVGAVYLLSPYAGLISTQTVGSVQQFFAPPEEFLPGGVWFPGWFVVGLALAGLLLPARWVLRDRDHDPRAAIAVGAILCSWLSVGGQSALPDLYGMVASIVPGMGSLRGPGQIAAGASVGVAVLGGLGVAGSLRLVPAFAAKPLGAVVLVVLAAFAVFPARWSWGAVLEPVEVANPPEVLAFFRELERLGIRGPILELPRAGLAGLMDSPRRMLLATSHGMRTSACYSSVLPAFGPALAKLSSDLPSEESVRMARDMGFRAIIIHRGRGGRVGGRMEHLFEQATGRPGSSLERVASWEGPPNPAGRPTGMVAYRIAD
jgi:hypothetical protein